MDEPGTQAPQKEPGLILDACVLLNLWATQRIVEIIRTLPRPCAVAQYVRDREALWVGRHRQGPAADYERIDLSELVACDIIEVLALEGEEEMAHFIALASSPGLDDGEAMSGALAHSRGLVVATDDRAALATFARHHPPISTRSTASLIKHWVECASVDDTTLRTALGDIRERACFEPGVRDPLHGWWRTAIGAG
jgi:hypothetical protein